MDREEYVERVLALVEQIPRGRVMSYGAIAELIGVGGPRQVGRVMALEGGGVPWWRVVRADGGLPECHSGEAIRRHRGEGTPLRTSGRVDMVAAAWWPDVGDGAAGSVGPL
ncbi:MAG TPA: MGMT family protein [Nocardioidaceae bacterium]|nr:MGMT family protein [Nocardioidaceae bacterium]